MDDMLRDSLAGFDELWQRVTCQEDHHAPSASAEETHSQEDELLRLIHEEFCAAAGAAALARLCQGDARTVLLRHAADARRHLRRLRAEYYILTGVAAGANEDCRPVAGKLAALRAAYLQAGQMARQYSQTANAADSAELSKALAGFADDELRRAQQLRALLVDSF